MSDITIKVQGLGKKYQIRHDMKEKYSTIREALMRKISSLVHPFKTAQGSTEDFWALKDVSFEIKRGECVGIIGRNGAGKSTLLKILSRITEPTTGRIEIHGRVTSLLEVGTGFHQELTGRENIYLNGTILGMTKKEIDRKFDEIVAFAEIDKFLDTPVKRYSSGMYVRLAFAVAAHLECEILVVDEVLAVGDAQFQKKCLGKMGDVAQKDGKTVLFVSHNMQAIRALCSRAILLKGGQVSMDGRASEVIDGYNDLMKSRKINAATDINDYKSRRGQGVIRFTSIEVTNEKKESTFNFNTGDAIYFRISYEIFKSIEGISLCVLLKGGVTREVVTTFRYVLTDKVVLAGVKGEAVLMVPNVQLRPGEYPLYFWLGDKMRNESSIDVVDEMTPPLMIDSIKYQTSEGEIMHEILGYASFPSRLEFNSIKSNEGEVKQ